MNQPFLDSIQRSRPRHFDGHGAHPMERAWSTGIFKDPIEGEAWLGATNLEGDGQADLEAHGGPDKAVLAYSADCYPAWRTELGLDLHPGAFGENFTISGQSEQTVCIGDLYRIGEARVEVSQPRQPCWKLARKWGLPNLPALVVKTGRSGWYLRVRKEGRLSAGVPVELIERPFPEWTVARASDVAIHLEENLVGGQALAMCGALAEAWRRWLAERIPQLLARRG